MPQRVLVQGRRHNRKNIVAAGLADRCEVQVSYAIGVAEPTSISVFTFGTGKISDAIEPGDDRVLRTCRPRFDWIKQWQQKQKKIKKLCVLVWLKCKTKRSLSFSVCSADSARDMFFVFNCK